MLNHVIYWGCRTIAQAIDFTHRCSFASVGRKHDRGDTGGPQSVSDAKSLRIFFLS